MGEPVKVSLYDEIGHGYSQRRCEDPVIRAKILQALGESKSIVNVGAGTGSYEPLDRLVIPIEPSAVMAAQRPNDRFPVIKANADNLPLHDKSVDAAMAVLSLHHWSPLQGVGLQELVRVARDRIVILTIDPEVSGRMWLMADYLTEVADLDRKIFPAPQAIARLLGGKTTIDIIAISRATRDGMLLSFWAHPERVLDPIARGATSGFACQPEFVIERVVSAVRQHLDDGTWDKRYGNLRSIQELDVGLRLITARF